MLRFVSALMLSIVSHGCTGLALERGALAHAESSSDLRYREAIENLALVYSNPDTLPAYSSIFAGTTDISDSVQVSSTTTWARTLLKPIGSTTGFATQTLDIPSSRTIKKNWTLDPTFVPEKLRAMRAACQWAVFGPEQVIPDALLLSTYQPAQEEMYYSDTWETSLPDVPQYYFAVDTILANLPDCWLNFADRWTDIPRRACYWAGCRGKYVWVGPEGMGGLSEFVLALQKIARADLSTVVQPKPLTRTIKVADIVGHPGIQSITVYVDRNGHLTPGNGLPSLPRKARFDNVGNTSDLKSVINASAKAP